jgi:hypothetical protein
MAIFAWSAACIADIGSVAAVLDLSNRLFGVYRRTVWATSWRVVLTLVAGDHRESRGGARARLGEGYCVQRTE